MTAAGRRTERPVGLTQDAGWEIGVPRTSAAPVDPVWDYLVGATGNLIRFHQERLTSAAQRERMRVHWRGVLDRLVDRLERAGR